MQRVTLLVAGLVCALLGGCASFSDGTKGSPMVQESYVDAKMHSAVDSIDHSLKILVLLERGDQPAHRTAPLGWTVAGAASAPRQPIKVSVAQSAAFYSQPQPATYSVLDREVRISWDGSAETLLSSLAAKLGMQYGKVGTSIVPYVHVEGRRETAREVLSQVSSQISMVADIRVDVAARRIDLIIR
jgi:hypothetical protein